jgi:glycosyltransferase involved in cell wall biosynthesis
VCLAYLRHFGPAAQAVVQHDRFRRILDVRASRDLFALLEAPGRTFRSSFIAGALRSAGRWDGQGRRRPYLNVGHTGLNSPGFCQWVRNSNTRPIYLLHDLIPVTHPEFCRAGEAEKHRSRVRTVLTTAAGVIANSRATLGELASFARKEDLPEPPGLAAWLGSDPLQPALDLRPPQCPTFVTVGTIEARKNHRMLLEIWSRLVDRLGSEAPLLLIIGQRGWEADEVFALLDRIDQFGGRVTELNDCSDEELARHLASARALLFPSHAEGYGLPLLEALGLGVPVIASDLPVFRELVDDIPDYVDPLDSSGWEAAIVEYARADSAARDSQVRRLGSLRLPDWDSHFAAVERWLFASDGVAETGQYRLNQCLNR